MLFAKPLKDFYKKGLQDLLMKSCVPLFLSKDYAYNHVLLKIIDENVKNLQIPKI